MDEDEKGPEILDIPVGLAETGTRQETDSMGAIDVPPTGTGARRRSVLSCTSRSVTTACRRPCTTPTATPVHPNDHVNMGQSSSDTFPAAMHIAAVQAIQQRLRPSVQALRQAIAAKASQWRDVVKTGRTHLQDAVPLTVGQEGSGYAHLREYCIEGAGLNRAQIDEAVSRSLMLVTALSPVLGYDKAAAIAHRASADGTTLRDAAIASGEISGEEFDRIVDPSAMTGDTGHLVM